MIALIQRVHHAHVDINSDTVGQIGKGLLVLLGIEQHDNTKKANQLLHKILHYRMFQDNKGKMNLNVQQIGGQILVVSQFTLAADTQKGLRPNFSHAAPPEQAITLYHYFCQQAAEHISTQTGQFGADMQVSLQNDGPVTFWLQT